MQLTLGKALFLFFTILSINTNLKNNESYKAKATNESILVSTFDSDVVVTGPVYKSYQNDEWLITVGGNNRDIGTDSFSSSQAQLNTRTNLTAFNPSISGTTRYISAVISKNTLSNINGISISRNGSSYYNYSGVSTYLVCSNSLEGDYSLITTIGSITTPTINYSFEKEAGNKYYALVFYNPSGVFSLGGVVVNFYSTEERLMNKVTSKEQLIFSARYGLVSESSSKLIAAIGSEIDVEDVDVDNDRMTTSNRHEFILGIGSEIGTYTLFSDEAELYIDSNENSQIVFSTKPLLFTIDFNNGASLKNPNNQYLYFDSDLNKFTMSEVSNVTLFINEKSIDHDLELRLFVDEVLVVDEGAKGNCEETYIFLSNTYERLSTNAQYLFINSQDHEVSQAKETMTYLSSWANQNLKTNSIRNAVSKRPFKNMVIISGLTITGLISFSIHVILKKKIIGHD